MSTEPCSTNGFRTAYNRYMPKASPKSHTAAEFDLDILNDELDLFRWFLLCLLFGKPIRSSTAVETWHLFVAEQLDTPWAIAQASERQLVRTLHDGGYTRYQHVTAAALKTCMDRLLREYDGSLMYMLESSLDQAEFSSRLQKLHGVGPKVAEIFMTELDEYFARRAE